MKCEHNCISVDQDLLESICYLSLLHLLCLYSTVLFLVVRRVMTGKWRFCYTKQMSSEFSPCPLHITGIL